jgi:hypothetical protein
MLLFLQLTIAGQLLTLANVVGQFGDWLQSVICTSQVQQETWFRHAFGPYFNETHQTVDVDKYHLCLWAMFSRKFVHTL